MAIFTTGTTETTAAAPRDPGEAGASQSGEVVQPLPTQPAPVGGTDLDLADLPTLEELEAMSTDELDELLGLKPKFDIPPAARRSMEQVGILGQREGVVGELAPRLRAMNAGAIVLALKVFGRSEDRNAKPAADAGARSCVTSHNESAVGKFWESVLDAPLLAGAAAIVRC